jgi:RNAse (barnase) inhibitor barstar
MKITPPVPDAAHILRDSTQAAIQACSEDSARALFQAAPAAGYHVYKIDLGLATDASKLHQILARALHFPEWYGRNWDALADSLTDMSWSEADGYLLILQRAEVLHTADAESFATLLGILEDSAGLWREQGVAFRVLLIGDFPELPSLQVRT